MSNARSWAGWFLLLCALLPFAASRHAPNVHDDAFLRGAGSLVADPETGAADLWRADVFGTRGELTGQSGFWRPLVLLSFRAEYDLTGGAEVPFAWLGHVVNLLLHALATLALWRVLLLLELPAPAALAAAALFAVHPIHAESVAWLSGRSDVGATAFGFLGTALLLRRPREDGGRALDGEGLLASALLVAALLFKESAVLLAGLAVLALRGQGRPWRQALAAPALALLAYAVLRGALFTRAIAPDAYTGPASAGVRWATWLAILPEALRLLVWPGAATPVHPVAPATSWSQPAVLVGAVTLLILVYLCLSAWRRREAALGYSLLVVTGTLLMLAPWVRFPTGFREVAAPLYERYFYAAAAGPPIALAWLLRQRLARAPLLAAAATLAAVLAIRPAAAAAGAVWSSDEAFARAGLAAAPRSANLWNHLGVAKLEVLRAEGDRAAGEQALQAFQRARVLQPDLAEAEINEFIALAMLGREDEATEAAHHLLMRRPDDPAALDNVAQWHRGRQRWQQAADLLERELATGRPRPGAAAALDECLRALEAARAPSAEPQNAQQPPNSTEPPPSTPPPANGSGD
jgi:hypothetical protein